MNRITAKHFIQSRPVFTFTTTCISGLFSYGYFVEWQTGQLQEEQLRLRHDNGTVNGRLMLPRTYDRNLIEQYWEARPITVVMRIATITNEVLPILWAYVRDYRLSPFVTSIFSSTRMLQSKPSLQSSMGEANKDTDLQRIHAIQLRSSLTRLGPAFIKFGQQLSIRPDILPHVVLKELQALCDNVEPAPMCHSMRILREDFGDSGSSSDAQTKDDQNMEYLNRYLVMDEMELVASASLGQVYRTRLRRRLSKKFSEVCSSQNEWVAVKIQRPDMLEKVSLDMYLLNRYGTFLDWLFEIFTEQIPFHVDFIDCFARGSYLELDYENEAANQKKFKSEFKKRNCRVYVPDVHSHLTSRRVLTTEWIDGVKLADAPSETIRDLIPVGVELFLTQLLDIGAFHADPHPGNLYVTKQGTLCLLDFGLCADIDPQSRRAMTAAIVHLLNGDFDSLIMKDAKDLGFLPYSLDVTNLKPILTKILTEGLLESGSDLKIRKRKLMGISDELNDVFFKYPFKVPPFFALVTRGLGLLEGIALVGDPDFDIFRASYPYASRRAAEMYGLHSWDKFKRFGIGNNKADEKV